MIKLAFLLAAAAALIAAPAVAEVLPVYTETGELFGYVDTTAVDMHWGEDGQDGLDGPDDSDDDA